MPIYTARVIGNNISFRCDTESQAEALYDAYYEDLECPICNTDVVLGDDECPHLLEVDEEADHVWEVREE